MDYLFDNWKKLKRVLQNRHLLLFLDYDGTLTPIVDEPTKAVISKETKELLEVLAKSKKISIAVVSGRALKDIKKRVGLKDIIYVGNHGLELEGPKIDFRSPVSHQHRTILEELKEKLNKRLSGIKGIILEDKGLSLSIHYRMADRKDFHFIKTAFRGILMPYLAKKRLKIKTGKMVLEIKPPLGWDKGKVVLWLLAREKFLLQNKPLMPIYIGDDTSDEDAFKRLRDKGLTIFVGKPKESYAEYRLRNTEEVYKFLKRILEMQKVKDICRN